MPFACGTSSDTSCPAFEGRLPPIRIPRALPSIDPRLPVKCCGVPASASIPCPLGGVCSEEGLRHQLWWPGPPAKPYPADA
eukprot:723229-Rhodomonas_salina.1